MKFTKQARMLLLVVLASASILPGCGKSKNSPNGVVVGGPGGGAVVVPGSNGAPCNLNPNDTPCISNATGALYGLAPLNGPAYGGNFYHKINSVGDDIYLSVLGSPIGNIGGTQVSVNVSVSFGPYTMSAFNIQCGGQVPTYVGFTGTYLVAGSPGTISNTNSMYLVSQSGCSLRL